jgi:uracil-DNA glycosylase family 4
VGGPLPVELAAIEAEIVECRRCPRLVAWREQVARDRVARFRAETYWGRPVPGFGDPNARIVLIGLAPGAHGANRTGRMFTGDGSGDFLWPALHAAGLASQPESRGRDDGLRALDLWVTAPVRCVPPDNRPTTAERDACAPYLARELAALPRARVLLALGAFGWDSALRALAALGTTTPAPKPRFAHGAEVKIGRWTLLGSYHVSQQNTFTGRLTRPMLDAVFARAIEVARG